MQQLNSLDTSVLIHGHNVTFQPPMLTDTGSEQQFFNYAPHIQLISDVVKGMFSNDSFATLCIEGASGSGKSTLAKVLSSNGQYVDYYSCLDGHTLFYSGRGGKQLTVDFVKGRTYVIDDVDYCTPDLIAEADKFSSEGGIVILMFQDVRNFSGKLTGLERPPRYFKLTRNALSLS